MFKNAVWGCVPSKAQPTPCAVVGNSPLPSPHRVWGSPLPCNAVKCCVLSQNQGKSHCSPPSMVPALQRSLQEHPDSLPGAMHCSKVCAVLPRTLSQWLSQAGPLGAPQQPQGELGAGSACCSSCTVGLEPLKLLWHLGFFSCN